MSLIAYRMISPIVGPVRAATAAAARLIARAVNASAEARMHRIAIEVELYRRHYKHASKNDDDLPIVR